MAVRTGQMPDRWDWGHNLTFWTESRTFQLPLESFRRSTYDWPPSALLPESIVRQWELILCKTSADHASKGLDKDRSFNKSPAMKSVQILKVYCSQNC